MRLNGEPFIAKATPISSSSKSSVEVMFISGRLVRHALRSGTEGFLVWVTAGTEDEYSGDKSAPVIPQDLKDLLEQFSDVFPDALPAQLPPRRFVNYEIKIEEGSAPPSRPAYR